MDLLSDVLFLGVATLFFVLSLGLIAAVGRLMPRDAAKGTALVEERQE